MAKLQKLCACLMFSVPHRYLDSVFWILSPLLTPSPWEATPAPQWQQRRSTLGLSGESVGAAACVEQLGKRSRAAWTLVYLLPFCACSRLRALSSGGSVASPPPSPAMPKYKLADYRYGREEMLALYVKENKVG